MRRLLLIAALAGTRAAAGEALPVAVPESLERLDPLVVELVETKLAETGTRSDSAERHGDLGLVYEANILWREARASFENAVRLADDGRLWRFHLALARRELGDFAGALELLQGLAGEDPGFAAAAERLGQALLEAGDLAAARAQFERLTELEPEAPQGWAGLGDVLLRSGDAAGAARALERAARLSPGFRAGRYLLGTAYLRLGRRDDARRELELGVGAVWEPLPDPLAPRISDYAVNLTALLDRAGVLLAAGEAEQAAAVLEKARAAHPRNVTVANNLAVAYLRLDRLDAARALLVAALAADGEKLSTHLNLAQWALRAGRPEQALGHAEAAVGRAPELAQPYFTRAQALAALGRFDEALASLGASLEREPRNPAAETFSGDLCLELRRYDAARGHYHSAAELAPRFLPAWLGLARASAALGDGGAARAALAEARKIAPGHPLVARLEGEIDAPEDER